MALSVAFSSGQRHSWCVYSRGKKGLTNQTHSLTHPQSVQRILGPAGDRRVLNLLQNFASSAPLMGVRGVKSKMRKIRASRQLMGKLRKIALFLLKIFPQNLQFGASARIKGEILIGPRLTWG